MTTLTVLDGLRAYARMINRLDVAAIESLLAPSFGYASQWVFSEMTSREEFLDYIRAKIWAIRRSASPVWAEMGTVHGFWGGPCVVLAQHEKDNLVATVLLQVADNLVSRIDLCAVPEPWAVVRSGEYPQ